jgi:hypothetical protein
MVSLFLFFSDFKDVQIFGIIVFSVQVEYQFFAVPSLPSPSSTFTG